MKVYVIIDPLIEQVIGVYKHEDACLNELDKLGKAEPRNCYQFEYDEYELNEG